MRTGKDSDTGAAEGYLAEDSDAPPDVPSFYQKNSGSLPKSGENAGHAHIRANLPRATKDADSLFVRLRRIIGQ